MKVATFRNTSWEDQSEAAVRLWNQARETSDDLLYQLNRHVRRNPWKAVAIALAAGAVLGCVVTLSGKR